MSESMLCDCPETIWVYPDDKNTCADCGKTIPLGAESRVQKMTATYEKIIKGNPGTCLTCNKSLGVCECESTIVSWCLSCMIGKHYDGKCCYCGELEPAYDNFQGTDAEDVSFNLEYAKCVDCLKVVGACTCGHHPNCPLSSIPIVFSSCGCNVPNKKHLKKPREAKLIKAGNELFTLLAEIERQLKSTNRAALSTDNRERLSNALDKWAEVKNK